MLSSDHRSAASHRAFDRIAEETRHGVVVSVGGGPLRVHPLFRTLNLEPYPNVDVVGTAYRLPFADGALAGVHCEAVVEHLEHPDAAATEMARVLRPGGVLYSATPFLQPYHGYPDHYQNYTLPGHVRLFERAGLEILDSGTCVGPAFALVDLAANFVRHYVPTRLLSRGCERVVRAAGSLLRLADLRLRDHRDAHVVASTTFVLARRPPR